MRKPKQADVCLLLEGTYPYVAGGVSTWTSEFLKDHSDLTFSIVTLVAPGANLTHQYTIPKNVASLKTVTVQELPTGTPWTTPSREDLFRNLELPLLNMQHRATLGVLDQIIKSLGGSKHHPGSSVLLNSSEAWKMLLRMYFSTMGDTSFLDYFWTWRGLLASMYSVLLCELPPAKLYHALCTGYAGLLLARAHLETQRPCVLTEHGIYTNERKIEITAAEWLHDEHGLNLNVNRKRYERDLRDFWIDTFSAYASLCYAASDHIITLSEANQEMQLADGANPSKMQIIPNGIDYTRYSQIKKDPQYPTTIALIGRVVPIKDVKTYLLAAALVLEQLPTVEVLVIGSVDEDPEYYQECLTVVKNHGLEKKVTFTGKVNLDDYLPRIDLVVLTSISEGQPLVILEAGAAGIPSVCTDVGDCRDLLFGKKQEDPWLGEGGLIALLTNPGMVARCILDLLTNRPYYERCSRAIQQRVATYYRKEQQKSAYQDVYEALWTGSRR